MGSEEKNDTFYDFLEKILKGTENTRDNEKGCHKGGARRGEKYPKHKDDEDIILKRISQLVSN